MSQISETYIPEIVVGKTRIARWGVQVQDSIRKNLVS